MRIYLDACSLQRPMDDRSQPRVNIEAEAVLTILSLVEAGDLELLSSEALQIETAHIPDGLRRVRTHEILALASCVLEINDEIEALAKTFVELAIKPMDALHLASASLTKADYFCTCDDKLLRKCKKLKSLNTKAVSPLQLIAEVTP